jgi:hypothetical protein
MQKLKLDIIQPQKDTTPSYTVSYPCKYQPNPEYPFRNTRLQFSSDKNIYKPTLLENVIILLISVLLTAFPLIIIYITHQL